MPLIPHIRGFKIASLNIVSLPKHIDELRLLMCDQNLDVIAINETRLSSSIDNSCIHIPGYDIVRRGRNRLGGGVCIYVRSSINFKTRPDLMSDVYEAVVLHIIEPNSQPFSITAVYRPPGTDNDFFCFLENTIKYLDSENKEVIVIGDLNCDYSPDKIKTHDFHKLTTISEVFQFTQIIDKPTRITATSKSIIDLLYTNQLSRVVTHGVVDYGVNDHCLVYVVRKVAVPSSNKHKYVTTRSFKKFKANKFAQELRNLPWGNIESLESPNEMWDVWKQLFLSVADKHAPLKTKGVRHRPAPWLTPELNRLIINCKHLKQKANSTGDPNDWSKYKAARNKLNNNIRLAKSAYYHEEI